MTFTANMGALTIIYTYIFRPNSVLQDRELGDQLSANIVVLLTGWKCSVGKNLQNIEIYVSTWTRMLLLMELYTWKATAATISMRTARVMFPDFRASIVLKENLSGILTVCAGTLPLAIVGEATVCGLEEIWVHDYIQTITSKHEVQMHII